MGLDEFFVLFVGVAALSRSLLPSRRGALSRLLSWSRCQAALSVSSPWGGARPWLVGHLLGGFLLYLANFADYGVTYGSMGAAVGLLFYLYLCASVVLLGAEVNAVIYHSPTDAGAIGERKQQ